MGMNPTKDAALAPTTSGWWEVELFELTAMPTGEQRMAHVFREHLEDLGVATGIVQDWLAA